MSYYRIEYLGHEMQLTIGRKIAVFLVALALAPALSRAQICDVPSPTHPKLQGAIENTGCATINLADQSYAESILITRTVSILGPVGLANINGFVQVQGASTVVEMTNLMVENGCTPAAFLVNGGGQVNSERLEVVWVDGGPCPTVSSTHIFSDDFESSDTSAWSAAVP